MVDSQTKKQSGRKLFFGLFIFPLIIAVGMAVLLCSVVLLTREVETPESLITAIKTGSPSKRWQKAFELSNELNQGRGMIRQEGIMKEVIHIMNNAKEYDPKTRSFMAMALSKFNDEEARLAIRKRLEIEQEQDVTLYLVWASGILGDTQAAPLVRGYLSGERDDLQSMAAYVLGVIGNAEDIPSIEVLLADSNQDVRWNAALALARLGSSAGYGELKNMTDRKTLITMSGMDSKKIEEIMINAIKGMALLNRPDSLEIITELSKNDSSLKVRRAALETLETVKKAAA